MKIGVYGDSFAESYPSSQHFAWYNLLPKFISGAKVTTYGKGGSSVFYSYNTFLQTHIKNDLVIFLVTDPNRYTKSICVDGDTVFPHSLAEVDHLLKNNKVAQSDHKLLEGLRSYFINVIDEEYHVKMTELMLTHIENTHPNVIFFPCFSNSLLPSRLSKCGFPNDRCGMASIIQKQSNMLGIDNIGRYKENPETISCHFTEEFNRAIAEMFATKILEDVWNWKAINKTRPDNNRTHYYTSYR